MNVMRLPPLFILAVERALNAALEDSARAPALLAALAGHTAALEIRDTAVRLYLLPEPAYLRVTDTLDEQADVRICGPLSALARTALNREGLPRGLEISGDAALAQQFQQLLHEAELDWEDLLARKIGLVPAHEIGRLARAVQRYGRHAADVLAVSAAEYLREEIHLLPPRREVDAFLRAVDVLRDDAARLETRLRLLAGRA